MGALPRTAARARLPGTDGAATLLQGFALGSSPEPVRVLNLAVIETLTLTLISRPWIELQVLEGATRVTAFILLGLWGIGGTMRVDLLIIQMQRGGVL